jgi:hypothetical protein
MSENTGSGYPAYISYNNDMENVLTKIGAVLGTCLGLFNTWIAWRQRKVQVSVIPITMEVIRVAHRSGGTESRPLTSPGLKIVNKSSFPVTIEEVGYSLKGSENYYLLTRLDMPGQSSKSGFLWTPDKFPQRLEARTSLRLAWWDKDEDALKGKRIVGAYAKTTCGIMTKVGRFNLKLRTLADELAKGTSVMKPLEDRVAPHCP